MENENIQPNSVSEETQASEAVENDTADELEGQEESTEAKADGDKPTDSKEAKDKAELEKKEKEGKLSKTEAKKLKKLKLKVDGKEMEEELPFEVDESNKEVVDYLTKTIQMAKMGQKRAGEYSSLQKDVGAFFEALKKDPASVLSDPDLGIDIKKLAAQVIEQDIENSKKSPEQLEREKLEQELKRLKDEREQEKKSLEEKEFQRMQEQAAIEYDRQIDEALQSSTIPKNPYTIKKIADFMLIGLKEGLDVSAKDVLPLVEAEIREDIKQMFAVAPEELIEQLIGKDVLKKMRKKNVDKVKESAKQISEAKNIKDTGEKKPEQGKPKEKQKFKDFFGI